MRKLYSDIERLWGGKLSLILFFILLGLFIFTRTYLLEERANFSWDQTTIAWAVKHILVDHQILLTGMPAKLNAGFSIGPLYYYYSAVFYWFTNLDPVASLLISVTTAIINFFVIFFIIKKLFNLPVAFLTLAIEIVSVFLVTSEQSQWPVPFIPTISLLIFYALYRALTGNIKYLLLLGFFIGLSFHIHFTSVFFPVIVLCCLPFFPRKKETFFYFFGAAGIAFVFLLPNVIAAIQTHNQAGNNLVSYLHQTFRFFHGRHFLQLTHDAFIQFELTLGLAAFWSKFIPLIPLGFCVAYFSQNKSKSTRLFLYLFVLWILIPWIAFTMYTGELTDYYFSINRPLALFSISFLLFYLWQQKIIVTKIFAGAFFLYFFYINCMRFFAPTHGNFDIVKENAFHAIQAGEKINYTEGVPEAYFYYVYTREKDKE